MQITMLDIAIFKDLIQTRVEVRSKLIYYDFYGFALPFYV
jgi:hypothetical protein